MDIRCTNCNKKLFEADINNKTLDVKIRCNRCKYYMLITNPKQQLIINNKP